MLKDHAGPVPSISWMLLGYYKAQMAWLWITIIRFPWRSLLLGMQSCLVGLTNIHFSRYNVENQLAPASALIVSSIWGRGYEFLCVTSWSFQYSTQNLVLPSLLLRSTVDDDHRLVDTSSSFIYWIALSAPSLLQKGSLLGCCCIGAASPMWILCLTRSMHPISCGHVGRKYQSLHTSWHILYASPAILLLPNLRHCRWLLLRPLLDSPGRKFDICLKSIFTASQSNS